jgi:hypothetical protein
MAAQLLKNRVLNYPLGHFLKHEILAELYPGTGR